MTLAIAEWTTNFARESNEFRPYLVNMLLNVRIRFASELHTKLHTHQTAYTIQMYKLWQTRSLFAIPPFCSGYFHKNVNHRTIVHIASRGERLTLESVWFIAPSDLGGVSIISVCRKASSQPASQLSSTSNMNTKTNDASVFLLSILFHFVHNLPTTSYIILE